jgi:2'-5' RNA ligase
MDGAAPLAPPEEWFGQAAADSAPEKITVFPGGRVAGVVAPAGRCLLNGSAECWMIPKPRSQSELDLAHTGFTKTASGTTIKSGVLAGGGGHASEWAGVSVAQRHYADTNTQLMRGVYRWSDKAGGLTFVGAVWPEVTPRQIAEINASPASIDYRWIEDEREHRLVGATLVNIGGLPTRWRASKTASGMVVVPERAPAFVAALGESDGTMIALRIDAPSFALPGGMPPEQMHLTLAYFGSAAQYLPEVRAAAVGLVGQAVEAFGAPILLEVSAVGILGPVVEQVVALLMQGEALPGFRELAMSAGEAAGLVCDDSYACFTPHITVGPYPGNLDAALALVGTMVSPPSVVVAFGSEDWTEFPLPRVGRPLEVETFIETESPAPGSSVGSVSASEEDSMVCEHCGTAKTAAPPVEGDLGDPAAQAVSPEAFAELQARVDALEAMVMQAAMASLAAADVAIPATV